MCELQEAINEIFQEHKSRFFITRMKNMTIIRILCNRYYYIHVNISGIMYSMQLFELDINTGEKNPISTKITGTAYEVMNKMKPTIYCW